MLLPSFLALFSSSSRYCPFPRTTVQFPCATVQFPRAVLSSLLALLSRLLVLCSTVSIWTVARGNETVEQGNWTVLYNTAFTHKHFFKNVFITPKIWSAQDQKQILNIFMFFSGCSFCERRPVPEDRPNDKGLPPANKGTVIKHPPPPSLRTNTITRVFHICV